MRSLVALSLVAAAAATPSFRVGTIHDDAAPLLSASNAESVPNSYIIRFKNDVSPEVVTNHHSWIQKIHAQREDQKVELRKRGLGSFFDEALEGLKHTYQIGNGFLGYSGNFDDEVIEQIRMSKEVSFSP